MVSRKPLPLFVLLAILVLSFSCSSAAPAKASTQDSPQAKPITEPGVERLDPAAKDIVPEKVVFQKVASGFTWTEGPVWVPAGYLLFSDIPGNSIEKLSADDQLSVFMHPSGYEGSAPYGGPEPGSNGLTLDRRGRLTVAGHARRNVWRLESLDPKAQITVLADSYEGKRLNSPNDLVYKSNGDLYFTDPPYGLPSQSDSDPTKELKVNGVYRLRGALDQKPGTPPDPGQLELLATDLPSPNGLAFSPDEKYLYVDNSQVQRRCGCVTAFSLTGRWPTGKSFAMPPPIHGPEFPTV